MEKKQYLKPELTVVTFRQERGYVISGELRDLMLLDETDSHETESFTVRSGWDEEHSGNFWL